jgi:hypothetical protein
VTSAHLPVSSSPLPLSPLALVVLATALAGGCSSAESAPPVPVATGDAQTPDADADLRALDVGAEELIADEASDDELVTNDWPQASDAAPDGDLVDLSDTPADLPEILPDPPPAPAQLSLGAASGLGPKGAPTWWSQTFACPNNPLHASCTCRGSLYNCQFANPQPGRNRYLPARAIRALRTATGKARTATLEKLGRWDLAAGQKLYEGAGASRGTITGGCYSDALAPVDTGHPCVSINFGQVKRMTVAGSSTPAAYVYAWDATADGKSASGWVLAKAITDPAFKLYDLPPRPGSAFAQTSYVVKSAEDYGCTPGTYVSATCLPPWAQLKIRPKSTADVSEKARDYMLRDGNVLNLVYQTPLVGGASTDTFLVSARRLGFRRLKSTSSDRRTILRISLYETKDATHAGLKVVGKMYFVYGEIAGRFGWVAAAAVKPGQVAATPLGTDTCDGKQDGLYCSVANPGAYECKNGSIASGQYCVAPATCVGPNGPGTKIVCQ